MFFIFLVIMMMCPFVFGDNKLICTLNHTVELESDTVYFFETPNFPRLLPVDIEMDECYITFTKNVSAQEFNRKFTIMTTDVSNIPEYSNYQWCKNSQNFCKYELIYSAQPAVKGFAYYNDWGSNDCLLESAARESPFEFTDISQIFVIQSVYDLSFPRNRSCLWQFKAPENYGFKITFLNFDISKTTLFRVETNKEIILTESTVRLPIPHYSTDNYLKIYLSKNISDSFFPNYYPELKAAISIIKNFWSDKDLNCNVTKIGNSTFWSFYDEINGYPNNAKCNYTLTIYPNTEILLHSSKVFLENKADTIVYYEYNNSKPIYTEMSSFGATEISFDALDKNTERNVLFEFKSDGSLQSLGFEIEFKTKNCICSNPSKIISCNNETKVYLMSEGDNDFKKAAYYCGNLKCSYTIQLDETCNKNLIVFSYATDQINNPFDLFRIITNNKILYERSISHSFAGYRESINIPANANNILQVITAPASIPRYVEFNFFAIDVFTRLPNIVLNDSKPYHIYDLRLNYPKMPYSVEIELSEELKAKNYSIDITIFTNDFHILTFFEDKNLSLPLNYENWFVLFLFSFRSRYYVITAFLNSFLYIKKLWTNPNSNGTINIYSGVTEKPLASFEANTANEWTDLFSEFYIIVIPPNTTIFITFSCNDIYTEPTYKVLTHPYKSIGTWRYYGQNWKRENDFDQFYFSINIFNYDIKLSLLDFDISESYRIYFNYNNTYFNVTSTFQPLILSKGDYFFYSMCNNSMQHCDLRMMIETIDINDKHDTTISNEIQTLSTSSLSPAFLTTVTSYSSLVTFNIYLTFVISAFSFLKI